MPVRSSEDQIAPLEIYLAYEFLPAGQYAKMLTVLDALYQVLARDPLDGDDPFLWHYYRHYLLHGNERTWPENPWLPLCIDSIETGQSINVRFAAKGKSASVTWRERELDILLPRSTAPLCAIGVLLTGAAWSHERYLDAQYKKAQIENTQAQTAATKAQTDATRAQLNLTAAQVELTRAQTAELLAKRAGPKRQQRTPADRSAHFEINAQVQNFYSIVNQPNFTRAEVNGIDVRAVSERIE